MKKTRIELMQKCEDNINNGYSQLKKIFDVIEDTMKKDGIEKACLIQDGYSKEIDHWLDYIKFFEGQLEELGTTTAEL